ncbi:hypothetical protein BH10ACT11_BH10ACT11_09010 [soil metagenome]
MTIAPGQPGGFRLRFASDERLARLAALGNDGAFEQVFERYELELYRYCRGILAHHEDAQDALQATMASALRALPGEKRKIALKPWLYRVAHNESISILRRRPVLAAGRTEPELAPGADIEAESHERLRQLVADLDSLPARQRGALTMRELSGMSYDEVGEALALSSAAARQAVFEARTALAELGEGRAMECEEARRAISARDGRVLRGRKLRAHIRSCDGCTGFEASITQRRSDFKLLSPLIPGAAGAGVLAGLIGGEATRAFVGPGLAKVIATVSAAAVVGTGAAQLSGAIDLPGLPGAPSGKIETQSEPPNAAAPASRAAAGRTRADSGLGSIEHGQTSSSTGHRKAHAPITTTGSPGKPSGNTSANSVSPSSPSSDSTAAAASPSDGSSQSGTHASNAGGAGGKTAAGSDPDLPATSNGKPPAGSNAGGSGSPVAGANSNTGGNSAANSNAADAPGQSHSQSSQHSNSSVHGGS